MLHVHLSIGMQKIEIHMNIADTQAWEKVQTFPGTVFIAVRTNFKGIHSNDFLTRHQWQPLSSRPSAIEPASPS